MLMSVKEYASKLGVSASTIQRKLKSGELKGKRFGRVWFVELNPNHALALPHSTSAAAELAPSAPGSVQELISFSSKALNSYLLMSDKLLLEKERAFAQMETQLLSEKQKVAELSAYVALLEKALFSERTIKATVHDWQAEALHPFSPMVSADLG